MMQHPISRMPLIEAPLEFRLSNGGAQSRRSLLTCPKCTAPMFIRKSDRLTESVKHILAHCTNTGCGVTAEYDLSLIHLINPGLIDRPDLNLPICPKEKIPQVLPPSGPPADDGQLSMFEAKE